MVIICKQRKDQHCHKLAWFWNALRQVIVGLGIRGCLLNLVALFAHLEHNLNHQYTHTWCSKRTCLWRREVMWGTRKNTVTDSKIPVRSGSWLHEVYYLAKGFIAIINGKNAILVQT